MLLDLIDQILILRVISGGLERSEKYSHHFTAAPFPMIIHGENSQCASCNECRSCNNPCGHYAKIASLPSPIPKGLVGIVQHHIPIFPFFYHYVWDRLSQGWKWAPICKWFKNNELAIVGALLSQDYTAFSNRWWHYCRTLLYTVYMVLSCI